MTKDSKIFSVCSRIFGTEGFVCALTAVMIAQYLIIFPTALCSVLNLILYAWGAPLMAVHLVRQQSFSKKSNKLWLLFYLIVSFFAVSMVSILIHVPQNIVSNLSAWYSCGLQVFFCCYVIACAKKEQARRLFSFIILTTVLATLAVAAACLVMQFLNIYPLKATTLRFTGLFYNPNNRDFPAQLANAMDIAIRECERLYPIFNVVMTKGLEPKQALYPLLLDTLGQA